MRSVAIAIVVLLGLAAVQVAGQGTITIGQIPATPINSVSWQTSAPQYSEWIPIYTNWGDVTRLPSTVTITIDFTSVSTGSLIFITSAAPTATGTSPVTLTLSGTALLNTNTPAGYFAFALVNTDPSSTTAPAPVIRIQASPTTDWPATVGNFPVQVVKRPVKISIVGPANAGMTDIAGGSPTTVSLVPGVLSQPITMEFLLPPQQPIGTVTVQIDPNNNFCGTIGGNTVNCGNFYNFLSWAPDSDTPPSSATGLNTQASWSNVPTGTRKLTFQIATHPSVITNFPPFAQTIVFQAQNGRYPNLAYFPSNNGSASTSYILPNLRLTLSGGDAGQYNPAVTNPGYLFNPVANINQVPVFLTNVNAPQMLTGTTKTFTYTLAHPLPGQSVTYNVLAPPGVTVNPTSFTFSCTTLSGGATGCPTTASVAVTIDNNFINDAYGVVRINVIQPSTSVNYAFPRTIPSIDINIVDRYTDNELIVDSFPAAVAAGQQFTFSMRTRIAPQPGNTINVRLISAEFKFDQPVYALSASNTGFMVTATALSSPLFKTINYPAAQDPSAGYTTGSEIVSVFGFITAIFSGAGARNFIKSGIWDAANSNFGVVVSGAATSTYAENIPAGGIEIYRPQFQYKQATLLNGGSYILTTWDQPSAQITVALKNAPAAGGVALTPVINCAYVTANPSVLTFTTGNNEATFTLTADRNGAVATAANLFGTNPCTVTFAMSGDQTFNYIAPPSFTVAVPTAPYVFTATIEGGLTNTNGNPRTFQIGVTPNFLPRPGNTVTLQPFWALGAFTPASQTWSSADTAFTKTFTVTENDFIDPSLFMGTAIAKLTSITWSVTGPDAGYYTVNALAGPTHATRTVNLPAAPPAITIGRNAMVKISLSDAPTAGTLVLTPVPNVPGALTFTPATYTFTAGAPTTALFQVTGNNIGSWYVEWELTGTDAYLYNSGTGAQFSTFTVGPRGGVTVNIAPPPAGFVSGAWYGPFDARVSGYAAAPLAAGSLTIAPTSDDWKFQPATLAFAANGVSAPFIMRYMPSAPLAAAVDGTSAYDFSTVIEYNLGGTDAWMFPIPAKSNFGVKHRSIVFSDETGASPPALSGPAGVPVLMWITLPDGPAPTGGVTVQLSSDNLLFAQVLGAPGVNGSSGSPALAVSFSGDIVRQQVLVWTNFNGAWGQARQAFPDTLNAKFSIYTTVAGPDAAHYADPADLLQVFTLVKKLFYFDTSSLAASWDNVLNSDGATQQFPLGQVSQVITVGTTGIVSTSVTLTPVCGHVPSEPFSGAGYTGCPYITFSPSELVFTAGQQTASFTFTPVALAPRGAPVYISWSITGADGYAWEIQVSGAPGLGQNIPNELFLQPVPSFKFSPMPAIWIDGKAENLVVTLNQPTGTFPAFQLQIRPGALGVVVEPDILQFSPNGANSQTFSIRHVRPSAISPLGHFYTLSYSVKYAGATTAVTLLPRVVPTDVTEVRLIRYAITPNFPTVLGLDFLKASINLTRAPFADVALVPHLPNFGSGQINVGSNPNSPSLFYPANNQVGVKVPGGRVIFDPPAITFLAGQLVSEFKVRADRLSDNEALYLRVDWEPVFHAEDVNCYYPFAYTWHIAAASTATMAWALVAALAALLLL